LRTQHRSNLTIEIIRIIIRFVLLVLVQVLVVQNINLTGYVILMPYVLFLLSLPFETNKVLVMLLGFVLGVSIDYFYDSSGLHAAACTLLGFARYYVLKYIAPREGYDAGVRPTIEDMGVEWYLRYAGTLVVIHHFALFYLEMFRFSEFFSTLLRVMLSSIATVGLIYVIQFIFFSSRNRS
jgi:hypothetical protein